MSEKRKGSTRKNHLTNQELQAVLDEFYEKGRKAGLDEAAALAGAWGDEGMEERILALKDREPGK